MAIHAGVGSSKLPDAREAGVEATKKAFLAAGIERADLVIAFASVAFNQEELVRGIREASEGALLVRGQRLLRQVLPERRPVQRRAAEEDPAGDLLVG